MESQGGQVLSDVDTQAVREVAVPNREGFHARPVMRFVDLASEYQAEITVTNLSGANEPVNGKSPMELMLLDAPQGSRLRIEARGADAREAVEALTGLVKAAFHMDSSPEA
jgi:phosphotransferase system HPr (HPr) family protein